MTDAQAHQIAIDVSNQLDLLVQYGKLQSHQIADIRRHLEPLKRPLPPPITARKPPSIPNHPALKQCKALWPYTGSEGDELSFQENDRIEIIEEVDQAWWKGCVIRPDASRSQSGLFPSNYVEEIQSSSINSPPLPARNMPPVYTPSTVMPQPSTYNDEKQGQGYQVQDTPQSTLGPGKWKPGVARWSSGTAPAMPPPPPSSHVSPSPATQGPSDPALYGTQQPVVETAEEKQKRDKLKKFGGRMGQTMATGAAFGFGAGAASSLFH